MLEQLDLIYGDLSPNSARILARLPLPDQAGGWRLSGTVRGPQSRYAQTLPATLPLRDLGPGNSLLASVTLPDPCYWSPDYPLLYRIRLELQHDQQVVRSEEFTTGLRRLGPRGRDLALESKRWVLRGAQARSADSEDLEAWHEHQVAQRVSGVDLSRCQAASESGVLLIVDLPANSPRLEHQLRQLARWPAAAFVVLHGPFPAETAVPADLAPHLLLGQQFPAGTVPRPESWCRVAFCELESPGEFARCTAELQLPVVAVRALPQAVPVGQLRAGCDGLQRELAAWGDYAGYLV